MAISAMDLPDRNRFYAQNHDEIEIYCFSAIGEVLNQWAGLGVSQTKIERDSGSDER
jgi:hypothetical protein